MEFLGLFEMTESKLVELIITFLIGGAGWAVALGRKMITAKIIEEASGIFVKLDVYKIEMRNVESSIAELKEEQKINHADMVTRLDKAVGQINQKIEMLVQ